jgi:NAD(P)-dependent dehydrogenase (short-subunit alcohol dehydrogenase family)
MADKLPVAVVAGVGPGLGRALAHRFAREGYRVAAIARDADKLAAFVAEDPEHLAAFACDLTVPDQVGRTMEAIATGLGSPDCAVFNASAFSRGSVLDIDPGEFERCWRVGAYAGLLFGQQVARRMVERGSGTILFTGATASLRGSANFANLASPKFALRALAQSMARELGPRGVHVAHIIIDGQIRSDRYEHLQAERGPDSLIEPAAIAETYWQLHQQPRSTWSFEIDVRPWVERF